MKYTQTEIDTILSNPTAMESMRLDDALKTIIGMLIQCNSRQKKYKLALENIQSAAALVLFEIEDKKNIADKKYYQTLDYIDNVALCAIEHDYDLVVDVN